MSRKNQAWTTRKLRRKQEAEELTKPESPSWHLRPRWKRHERGMAVMLHGISADRFEELAEGGKDA